MVRPLQSSGTFTNHSQCAKGDVVGMDHSEFRLDGFAVWQYAWTVPSTKLQVVELSEWMSLTGLWCVLCNNESVDSQSRLRLRVGPEQESRCGRTDTYLFSWVGASATHARASGPVGDCKVTHWSLCVCRGLLVNRVCPSLDQEDLL